jgi:hypothetical protein
MAPRVRQSSADLATLVNPIIRGWVTYYGSFYRTELRPTLKRIDLYVIRWARRKFKRLRRQTSNGHEKSYTIVTRKKTIRKIKE